MGTDNKVDSPILFFDGQCNLCNTSVQFVIKRDRKEKIKYASLQSDLAKVMLPKELIETDSLSSLVLLENGTMYTKSTAALQIAKKLKGLWPSLSLFLLVPKFARDAVYDFIAKNRYRWFGKSDHCMMPTSDLRSRFID